MMLMVTPSFGYTILYQRLRMLGIVESPIPIHRARFVNVADAVSESDKGQHSLTFSDTIFMANAFYIQIE